MQIQNSFEKEEGILYLVPTPIGNLEDMTFRAVRILKEVNWIAAEDTRNTMKLCYHFEIDTPMMSTHEHNEMESRQHIVEKLRMGENIALVSDAGTPCISDPGQYVVQAVIEAGLPVVPLPGANAAVTALIASGLTPQPFLFYGFLSRKKKEREQQLRDVLNRSESVILYESPHHLKQTLADLKKWMHKERRIVLARELTKRYEQWIRGTVDEVVEWAEEGEVRGEFCLILEGISEDDEAVLQAEWWESLSVVEHVDEMIQRENLKPKDAIRQVAIMRNVSRREVYNAYHQ
ncbi:16S rRNA (cytidine(1402)-2'-O)-methyltransferase [Savagea sp. SN6]|uniref:Ribosomal RNA small subunit methyltransferase I n=1 Tax=Savagea serpentis TaxID=2785297 RepID=A0A8J7GDM5_9BACL|nr:16S rRNA (cytidine(1402)-2'-O)-methyltransferase [Savagea serpentis]MBF4502305.1 16S rRNA (cytidine(1402)-2'-O)-methyltransferase [Savagea serpentis]